MILVVTAYVAGAGLGAALWHATHHLFDVPAFRRENYRHAPVVTGVGLLAAIVPAALGGVVTVVWAVLVGNDTIEDWVEVSRAVQVIPATVIASTGFCLLGLLDDFAGVGDSGGFRGHLRALSRGHLTTGGLKLLGGPLVALVAVSALRAPENAVELVRDSAVVALAANLANLFDRAPGRTNKVAQLGWVAALIVGAAEPELAGPAMVLGAAAALMGPDLREQMMLGDAGSNVLGAVVGLAWIEAVGGAGRWVGVAVLLAANVVSERWSFSRLIDSVSPLRAFDRWGSPYR